MPQYCWLRKRSASAYLIAACLLTSEICHAQTNPNNSITQVEPNQSRATDQGHYVANCERPIDHNAAELCEQRRMAKAAEDTVWWARLQTLIGLFGAIGLTLTLFFSGIATRAASKQVRLSRQALVETDRAFVFVSEGLINPAINSKTDKVEQWNTGVRWKNSGTTPTKNLRLHITLAVFDNPMPEDFAFPTGPVPDVHVLIAPGGTIDSAVLSIDLEQMEGVHEGTKHLYVWGWAEYDDVFDGTPRHRTEFCYKWHVGGNIRSKDKYATRYNLHLRHNGADEECEFPLVTESPKVLRR